jgi:hypothetical protein
MCVICVGCSEKSEPQSISNNKKKTINSGAQISQPITRRAWCSPEEDGWRIHHPNLIALSAFWYLRTPGVKASGGMTNDANFILRKKKKTVR